MYINGERSGNGPAKEGESVAFQLKRGRYLIEARISLDGDQELYDFDRDVIVYDNCMRDITLYLQARPTKETLRKKYSAGVPLPQMVPIPGGDFDMGGNESDDEKPIHRVTLSPFWMSATEITFEQYDACVAFGGCNRYPLDDWERRGNTPVINVNRDDAQQYVDWLKKRTGKNYRLPTEAEWEYAARAGSTGNYSWGEEADCSLALIGSCDREWKDGLTAPVASFDPNAFGLYDMHGNVSEWCQDYYGSDYYQQSPRLNPQGPSWGYAYVRRGGSWHEPDQNARSACREVDNHAMRYIHIGFRIVLSDP